MGKARRGESAGGGGAHIAGGEVRESQGRDGVGGSLVGRRAVVLRAVNHHCSLGFVSSVRPASFSLHAGVWSGGVKGEGQGFTRTRLGWLTAGRTAPRHGSARGAVGMNRHPIGRSGRNSSSPANTPTCGSRGLFIYLQPCRSAHSARFC
jgi:hypothetical protein